MHDDWVSEVLVIGAGPAGLASAYCLEQAGIAYTVIERYDRPASTWAGLYEHLRLNTASFVSQLPGKRMSLRYGIYPTGRDLYEYLREYADANAFHIRYGVEVVRVAPCEQNGQPGWSVEMTGAGIAPGARWFRFVIVGSGRFSKPFIPPIPGREAFQPQLLHARDYHTPAPFTGKRVLVAGSGPSGTDIALELAATAAHPVLLSVRSDIVIARPYPYGLPVSLWHLMARALLPERWQSAFLNRVLYHGYPDTDDLGLNFAPNRSQRRGSSAPVRGRDLIDAIHSGAIQAVPGIAVFSTAAVILDDDSSHAVDAVILSTGYRPAIDYLDFCYETDIDGWPRRRSDVIEGGSTEVKDQIGLFLVGRYYRGLGPLYNIRREAESAVREIEARRNAST